MNHSVLVGGLEDVEHGARKLHHRPLADRRTVQHAVLERLTFEELHHEVGGAFLRTARHDFVVEDLRYTRVLHLVGRVAFTEKSFAQILVPRDMRVQHLDRRAGAVAVLAGVHRGHGPHANQRFEGPLIAQQSAQSRAGCRFAIVFGQRATSLRRSLSRRLIEPSSAHLQLRGETRRGGRAG